MQLATKKRTFIRKKKERLNKGAGMAELGNPQNTIEVLQKYRFNFQKKFGQNFLIDTHVLDKIIDASGVTEDDFVLEQDLYFQNLLHL